MPLSLQPVPFSRLHGLLRYRDILINLAFTPTGHIVELQLNLAQFVAIKSGGGHVAYSVARTLQAFDPDVTSSAGLLDANSSQDIVSGFTKRFTMVGIESGARSQEQLFVSTFSEPSVQLIELCFVNVAFDLAWLPRCGSLPLLKTFKVVSCKVGNGVPSDLFDPITNVKKVHIKSGLQGCRALNPLNLSSFDVALLE